MMINKALHYKPNLDYHNIKASSKKKRKRLSLKETFYAFVLNLTLIILGVLIFVLTGGIAYKSYQFLKLEARSNKLVQENQKLVKKYQYLTSRSVVLEKAKKLGLRPPQIQDYLRLK